MPDTYPSPVWPSNATIEALNGTTDTPTKLPFLASGVSPSSSPTYQVQYDRLFDRLFEIIATVNMLRVVDEGTLDIGVFPGDYTLGGSHKHFDGNTGTTLTDDATNYVYLNSSNALTVSTSSYPADITTYIPLATVVCASGDISSITDDRGHVAFVAPTSTTSSDSGTDNVAFILDEDNASSGADTALKFNRGSTAADAQLEWNETDDRFELESELSGPTLATLNLLSILISGTTMLDSNGAAKVAAAVAGNGLSHSSGVLAVSTATANGTGIDSDIVTVAAGDGIALDTNGVKVALTTTGGLTLDGSSPNKTVGLADGESWPIHQGVYTAANGGSGLFVLTAQLTSGNTVSVYASAAPMKFKVIDAHSIAESADGGTWYVDNGSSAITDTVTIAASDTDVDRCAQINDANSTISSGGSLRVVGDGANADCTVYITCMAVA